MQDEAIERAFPKWPHNWKYIRTHHCEDACLPVAAPLLNAHFAAMHASSGYAAVQQIQGSHS